MKHKQFVRDSAVVGWGVSSLQTGRCAVWPDVVGTVLMMHTYIIQSSLLHRALAIDHGSHQDKAQRTLSFYNYINNLLPPVLWTSFSCFHLQAASVTAHGHQESRSLTVYRWRWTTWQLPKSKSKTSWSPPCWLAAGQVKSIFPEESFSHFRSTFDAIKKGDFLSWLHAIKSDGVHYCTDSGSANISGILWVCEEVGTHCSSLYMSTVQNY